MRIAIDLTDIIELVQSGFDAKVYHVVLQGPSGESLWDAWQQKRQDQDDQPKFQL
jgi:hypothetical protein